jgi:hypothetical protein
VTETNWLICRHCGQGPRYLRMPNGRIDQLDGHAADCPLAPGPEQPYGPGAICEDCGHFGGRHDENGCDAKWAGPCNCAGMLWLGHRWPRPWLPAPEGLAAP